MKIKIFVMKKQRTVIFIVTVVLLICIPFSPIFITSLYGTQPKSIFQGSDGFAYLWLDRKESFRFYLAFGFLQFEFHKSGNLSFRSEKGKMKEVRIDTANIEIDGKRNPLPDVAGTKLNMNFSAFNMYGGVGSSGVVKFDLAEPPKNSVRLHITGATVNVDGIETPFDLTLHSTVVKEESTLFLYQYFVAWLFQT